MLSDWRDVYHSMAQLDMLCEMKSIDVGLEVGDVLREGDVIRLLEWETMIREGSQLLGGDQLGIVIGAVFECAPNIVFTALRKLSPMPREARNLTLPTSKPRWVSPGLKIPKASSRWSVLLASMRYQYGCRHVEVRARDFVPTTNDSDSDDTHLVAFRLALGRKAESY